jgi:hypothetical protein
VKSHTTTILANALIALTKAASGFAMLQVPSTQVRALIPVIAVGLLAIACVLIARQRWQGALLALLVIGFFLLQFFLLGAVSAMFGYFILHVLAFLANVATFRALRQKPPRADQSPLA